MTYKLSEEDWIPMKWAHAANDEWISLQRNLAANDEYVLYQLHNIIKDGFDIPESCTCGWESISTKRHDHGWSGTWCLYCTASEFNLNGKRMMTFRIENLQLAKLDAIAEKENVSRSDLIRNAIEELIKSRSQL